MNPDIFDNAAEVIVQRGWVTGSGWNTGRHPDYPVCLEGAVMAAMGLAIEDEYIPEQDAYGRFRETDEYKTLVAYIRSISYASRLPYDYNDKYGMTKAGVIEALHGAANYARSQSEE